jgi:hypothetical protein
MISVRVINFVRIDVKMSQQFHLVVTRSTLDLPCSSLENSAAHALRALLGKANVARAQEPLVYRFAQWAYHSPTWALVFRQVNRDIIAWVQASRL